MSPSPPHERFTVGSNEYHELKQRSRQHSRTRWCTRTITLAMVIGVFQLGLFGGALLSKGKTTRQESVLKAPLPPRVSVTALPAPAVPAATPGPAANNVLPRQEPKPETAMPHPTDVKKAAAKVTGKQLPRKTVHPSPMGVPAVFHAPGDEATRAYAAGVIARVDRYKEYPPAAQKAGMEGRCLLICIVRRDGIVVHKEVVKSSGRPVLDHAAMRAVERVGAFPSVPETIRGDEVSLHIPVTFRSGT